MGEARTHTRRSPEAARALILDAAATVFARQLPDRAGLRDIASAAGVSHGLVTHYFGTYDQLVDEVIEHRLAAARTTAFARLATTSFAPDESPLLDVLLDLLEDAALARLLVWSLLTGESQRVLGKAQLVPLVDAMHGRLVALGARVDRERLELSILLAIAAVTGWSVAGAALARATGRSAPLSRAQLRKELERMLRAYVAAP